MAAPTCRRFTATSLARFSSTTIDHHIYVNVHRRFEPNIRVAYSKTETAATAAELQHELVREAMRMVGIDEPLEITTIGDVPAGTGMGSSSTLTVGLLTALYAPRGRSSAATGWARRRARSRSTGWASRSAGKTSMRQRLAG